MPSLKYALGYFRHPTDFRGRREAREASAAKSRLAASRPTPLPSKRIRLSQNFLPDSDSAQERHENPDSTSRTEPKCASLLFRLPFELRENIYRLAIGNSIICLSLGSGHIYHTSVPYPPTTAQWVSLLAPTTSGEYIPAPQATNLLPLLQTSRSIYREALPVLYKTNVFHLWSPLTLIYLHDLPLLRASALTSIRHLAFRWTYTPWAKHIYGDEGPPYDHASWKRLWRIVSTELPGLRTLNVVLEFLGPREQVSIEEPWVKEMLGVRGIESGVVEILFRTSPSEAERFEDIEKAIESTWTCPRGTHSTAGRA